MPALLAARPADEREVCSLIGQGADHIVGGPRECLWKYFNALRDFSEVTARCA